MISETKLNKTLRNVDVSSFVFFRHAGRCGFVEPIGWPTTMEQKQLLDESPGRFVQTLMLPRRWFLTMMMGSFLFLHDEALIGSSEWNISITMRQFAVDFSTATHVPLKLQLTVIMPNDILSNVFMAKYQKILKYSHQSQQHLVSPTLVPVFYHSLPSPVCLRPPPPAPHLLISLACILIPVLSSAPVESSVLFPWSSFVFACSCHCCDPALIFNHYTSWLPSPAFGSTFSAPAWHFKPPPGQPFWHHQKQVFFKITHLIL